MTILITRDLVARPEEAWASLASYCGLDPTNAKPLEAHKKFVSIKVQMFDHVYSLITFENYPSPQGFSARGFPQSRGSKTSRQG